MTAAREWGEIYNEATRQALTGVCFVALQRLSNDDDTPQPVLSQSNGYDDYRPDGSINHTPSTINFPEALRLRWLGMAAKIQQRNQMMTEVCVRLVKLLTHDGFHCCILKGQSNLVYYPEDLREARTPGDIDVLLRSIEEPDALDLPIRYCQERARLLDAKPPHVTYHHADLAWEGKTEVEVHYRATFLCSPLRNWRLQQWFRDNEQWGLEDAKIDGCESVGEHCRTIPVATVSFNAVYQLLHIYKHLFESGIGLRQLLDYYFVLRALHIEQETLSGSPLKGERPDHWQNMSQWAEGSCQREENLRAGSQVIPSAAEARQSHGMGMSVRSNAEILHTLSSFGMKRFASAVMYVLQTVFAMPSEYFICQPNEKEGKFLLNEIMQAGNFGKYDDRIKHDGTLFSHAIEKTKHNLRLLTHYPEEVIWEPFFRVYHWIWRRFELWRY